MISKWKRNWLQIVNPSSYFQLSRSQRQLEEWLHLRYCKTFKKLALSRVQQQTNQYKLLLLFNRRHANIVCLQGWGSSPRPSPGLRQEDELSWFPSARQSTLGMFFWLHQRLASSCLTEDQPDNVISWPIRCLDPYLIPQVGFPTDEPVERALLLLRANQ